MAWDLQLTVIDSQRDWLRLQLRISAQFSTLIFSSLRENFHKGVLRSWKIFSYWGLLSFRNTSATQKQINYVDAGQLRCRRREWRLRVCIRRVLRKSRQLKSRQLNPWNNLYVNLDIYTASLKQTTLIWHSLLKYHSTLRSFIFHENNLRRFNFLVHSDCR